MKKKKLVSLVLGATLITALCSCGKKETEKTDSTEKVTKEASEADTSIDTKDLKLISDGTLTIGSEIGYPPFETMAEDGVTPIGFDIDFAHALGEKLGLEVSFINTAWDSIFAGIGTNYDIVISAVTINDERKETMDFSTPYITNYQSVVVKKGSDIKINSLNDLNGKSVALQKGTTSDEVIKDLIGTKTIDASVVANEQVITCFTQLTNDEVDCVLCDSSVSDGYLLSDPDKYEKAYQDSSAPEQFGVAIKKGDTAMQTAINQAIKELQEEGFFEENTTKWFGEKE